MITLAATEAMAPSRVFFRADLGRHLVAADGLADEVGEDVSGPDGEEGVDGPDGAGGKAADFDEEGHGDGDHGESEDGCGGSGIAGAEIGAAHGGG